MKSQEGIAAGTVCKDLGTVQFTVVRVQGVLNNSLSLRSGSFAEGDNEHPPRIQIRGQNTEN